MNSLSAIRLVVFLLAGVGFFALLRMLLRKHALKGFGLIVAGFGLVYLNIVVSSVSSVTFLPPEWHDRILPVIGFISGYLGQTLGLALLLVGNYLLVRSLIPHLSEHYSSLVERALVGVYLIQDGVFRFVNPKLAEIFGYTREELIGMRVEDLTAEESRRMVAENLQRRMMGKETAIQYSFLGVKKDGTKIRVEVFGSRTIVNGRMAVHGTLLDISQREQTEETLRQSESRFRSVVESLGEGLMITDTDDTVRYINSRMSDLCGYTAEEMIGHPAFKLLLPPEEWPAMTERNQDRARGKFERYEVYMRRKDGTRFWTEVNASPYRDTEGAIIGTLGAVTDIQERKRAEALQSALYRIAEKTHSTVDLQEFYSSVHSIINELMEASNFYIALYEASTNTLSFPYFVDEVDPPPRPKKLGKGLTEHVLRTGHPLLASPEIFEDLLRRGEVESIGAPSIDWLGVPLMAGGTAFGAIVVQSYHEAVRYGQKESDILTFVSQHIATAIQRKADEERFRAVWEHSADGMRLTDEVGRIISVNSAFCRIVKLPQEKLVGELLSVTYRKSDADRMLETYKQGFATETLTPRFTGDIALWNGEEITVEVSNSFIIFGANHKMVLGVFRDTSDRALLESQLLHAQKMESIGVLAGGIAHDFNNVLSMILTSAEMLKEKTLNDPSIRHYADMVATAAERGAAIAKQLLLFARSEKGKLKPMTVSSVVLEVQKLLEHTLPKSISIRSEIESSDAVIMGDSDQIHQALLNLALNSRDAIEAKGEHGTIVFHVTTINHEELQRKFPQLPGQAYVSLAVRDNGIGMDETTRSRIFEPFFSTKGRGKGTGLGLSIVHGIINNHHGLIDVSSVPSAGTIMTFYLPLVPAPEGKPSHAPGEKSSHSKNAEITSTTILVVDDEPVLRDMLAEILEGRNYSVIPAMNGVEGIQKYRAHRDEIGIVISDLGMPMMGGEELFERLKEIDPQVKMIFMTGYLEENSRSGILRSGVKKIIHKPFRIDEIVECIGDVLEE